MKKPISTNNKAHRRETVWNKGKIVGQKKAFTAYEVKLIKNYLEKSGKLRDLTLFSVAIDTMLRASDLLRLKVSDVINPDGTIKKLFHIRQMGTYSDIFVGLGDRTCEILEKWIRKDYKFEDDYLFTSLSREQNRNPITKQQLSRLVKKWASYACLDWNDYSTHSLRRTKAAHILKTTGNIELVRQLLGHKSKTVTSYYLGMEKPRAIEVARLIEL